MSGSDVPDEVAGPQPDRAGDQLELIPGSAAARRAVATSKRPEPVHAELAETDPVARVLVDSGQPHLDRLFDYAVNAGESETAVPGARVKVRFAGKDADGFIVERVAVSDHEGRLQPLRRVVSPEPVLTPEIAELCATLARRYAGTRYDVLRLAIPPRHARTEKTSTKPAATTAAPFATTLTIPAVSAALAALARGEHPRLVWTVPPGQDGLAALAQAVHATLASRRGAVVCVPDHRDLARLDALLTQQLGPKQHVVLSADVGPAARYRSFLSVLRGEVKVAIGTRAAAFAPVRDLGLLAIWDDGDDLYAEPRAPYCHTREVLLSRAAQADTAVILAAHARSCETEYLVRTGWAEEVVSSREDLRRRLRVDVPGDHEQALLRDPHARVSRLPRAVFETLREGLSQGPVLVQSPRAGYLPNLACDLCRAPARCPGCSGPLRLAGTNAPPHCGWCGLKAASWTCPECNGHGLRAPVIGDRRTAEELGRAFPDTVVRTSSADRIVAEVPDKPAIVVATPGAEPVAANGFTAVILLDTWLVVGREDLRAAEEAVRRWMNAASLAREGGRALVVGDPRDPAIQAMVRWDPSGFARREIAERQSAHLPPASRVATIEGEGAAVGVAVEGLELPPGGEVLGPVPLDAERDRFVIRVPRSSGLAMADALRTMTAARAARKLPHLRVVIDPIQLG